jgi:hypothetical protein
VGTTATASGRSEGPRATAPKPSPGASQRERRRRFSRDAVVDSSSSSAGRPELCGVEVVAGPSRVEAHPSREVAVRGSASLAPSVDSRPIRDAHPGAACAGGVVAEGRSATGGPHRRRRGASAEGLSIARAPI